MAEHGDRLPKISTVADKHSCDLTGMLIHNSHLLVVNRATGRRGGWKERSVRRCGWSAARVGLLTVLILLQSIAKINRSNVKKW